jgi:hypothetical protein
MSRLKRIKPDPDGIWRRLWAMPDGRTLSLFLSTQTQLLVVDVIDADESGGNEIMRAYLDRVSSYGDAVRGDS